MDSTLLSRKDAQLLAEFLRRCGQYKDSTLSLAGTGPNCAPQLDLLFRIGPSQLRDLTRINLISGSCVAFFLYQALLEGQLKSTVYLNYDRVMRQLHRSSVTKLVRHLLRNPRNRGPLFDNTILAQAPSQFFEAPFLQRTLASFDTNLHFLVYCQNTQQSYSLNAATHPDISVTELCNACCSVAPLYGAFQYQHHAFIDPVFSQGFRELRRQLFASSSNHLYVNLKKSGLSEPLIFLKHRNHRFPSLRMGLDFLLFCAGLPNPHISRTNRHVLQRFGADGALP